MDLAEATGNDYYHAMAHVEMAESTRSEGEPTDPEKLTDEQLFQNINDVIVRERLFADPAFGRDAIMERFLLSKERVGAVFSKGSKYANLSDYMQELRLEKNTIFRKKVVSLHRQT